jgi:DNA transformation protein
MPFDPDFRIQVEKRLANHLPVKTKSMFGGVGIFFEDRMIALIAFQTLYIRMSLSTIEQLEKMGAAPFEVLGPKTRYYSVPTSIDQDEEAFGDLIHRAVAEAFAAAKPKPRPRTPKL